MTFNNVTLLGRVSTTILKRGDEVTVARTPTVDRLIAGGWMDIVAAEPAEPAEAAAPSVPSPAERVPGPEEVPNEVTTDD